MTLLLLYLTLMTVKCYATKTVKGPGQIAPCCFCKGPTFSSQHHGWLTTHGGYQYSLNLVPEDPRPASDLYSHCISTGDQTYIHTGKNTHTCKIK